MEEKLEEIEALIKKEEYDKAIELCDEIIKEDENCAMAYCLKGEALFYGPLEVEETIKLTTKALELDSTIARAYHIRGSARSWSTNYRDDQLSLQDYNFAIEHDSNYYDAYLNRGKLKMDLKDFDGALADFNSSIEINQDDYEAYSERGNAKCSLGDYYGALMDYDKAILMNPKAVGTRINRIKCFFITGQILKGILAIFGK